MNAAWKRGSPADPVAVTLTGRYPGGSTLSYMFW